MGREIKHVALDFNWPINKTWEGYLSPDKFRETPCEGCDNGYSVIGKKWYDRWWGYAPFDPAWTGSPRLTHETPGVRAFAERNVNSAPEYYGKGEFAIRQEGIRLAAMWNERWSHHLDQGDVQALVDRGRLMDFTHTWTSGVGWQKIEPPVVPTAADVNAWSLHGMGHDSINAGICVRARCEREGMPDTCALCDGHASTEAYPGQRVEAELWEHVEPPAGDGWQVWETVSEGSPISPVFPDREGLIGWLMSPAYTWGTSTPLTREQAEGFTDDGWTPSLIYTAATGLIPGDQSCGS